jgi:glycosyltransferase involved in cell wall biosynthesis
MKIGFLTTDARESFPQHDPEKPCLGTAPGALLQGFARLPETEAHVISCVQRPLRSPEKLADNIFFHCLHVPKPGWLRTGYQGCIRAVRNKLKAIQPDIVHGQGTERDCAISAVFSGFPNVITIHGNMRLIARLNHARPFSYEWLAARLESFTIPRAGGVVCITNYTRDAVADRAKKTWVAPNAADLKFFEVEAGLNPAGQPVILCIGAICPRKNQNAFIRALEPLARERKFQVVFLGSVVRGRAYDDDFFQLLGKNPWCSYAGGVHHEKLTDYLRDASLLALPSLEDNCPMVVLEAMAASVPVMAANVGGVPDLIEHGKTGLLCDPLDAAGIRDAVGKLLGEPELGRQLAAEAKKRALERFHPVVIARRHLEIYREALNVPLGADKGRF